MDILITLALIPVALVGLVLLLQIVGGLFFGGLSIMTEKSKAAKGCGCVMVIIAIVIIIAVIKNM